MLLVTLLDTNDMGSDILEFGDVIKMRQHYLRLFQRKISNTEGSPVSYSQFRYLSKRPW